MKLMSDTKLTLSDKKKTVVSSLHMLTTDRFVLPIYFQLQSARFTSLRDVRQVEENAAACNQ